MMKNIIMYYLGTKPGAYAQELIKNCEKLISDCNGDSINNPVKLLNLSVAETSSPGSSTVLIALFDGQVSVNTKLGCLLAFLLAILVLVNYIGAFKKIFSTLFSDQLC